MMNKDNRIYLLLISLSVLVPAVVAYLLLTSQQRAPAASWVYFLPHFHAAINSLTVLLLLTGYTLIRLHRREWHHRVMTLSILLGFLFLISYIIYHYSGPRVVFGDINHDGVLDIPEAEIIGKARNIYLLILFSHIVMAAMVVPFVLFAYYFALTGRLNRHKKLVKFAWPVWMYVSVTGVIVYWLVRPFY